jgi:hypothetical protein
LFHRVHLQRAKRTIQTLHYISLRFAGDKNREYAACYHQIKMASLISESALVRPRNLLEIAGRTARVSWSRRAAYRGAQITRFTPKRRFDLGMTIFSEIARTAGARSGD